MNTSKIPNYFTWNIYFLGAKSTIYYLSKAPVIFLNVKITCYFRLLTRYHVFVQKLTFGLCASLPYHTLLYKRVNKITMLILFTIMFAII